jgi:hypothetical protein
MISAEENISSAQFLSQLQKISITRNKVYIEGNESIATCRYLHLQFNLRT